MRRWNAWAAFFSPIGILKNSNRLNGVMTAVLGTSSGWTGIWWYPLIRSTFEKMHLPAKFDVKSWILGIG